MTFCFIYLSNTLQKSSTLNKYNIYLPALLHNLKQVLTNASLQHYNIFITGGCPPIAPDTSGICVHDCESDNDCKDDESCCFNGCSPVCTKTVEYGNYIFLSYCHCIHIIKRAKPRQAKPEHSIIFTENI